MELNSERTEFSTHPKPNAGRIEFPYRLQSWYDAYMSALFESDRSQIGERIKYAENLIIKRERELFNQPADAAEQLALNSALHALKALHTCLKL